jgi:hypothetical protein
MIVALYRVPGGEDLNRRYKDPLDRLRHGLREAARAGARAPAHVARTLGFGLKASNSSCRPAAASRLDLNRGAMSRCGSRASTMRRGASLWEERHIIASLARRVRAWAGPGR